MTELYEQSMSKQLAGKKLWEQSCAELATLSIDSHNPASTLLQEMRELCLQNAAWGKMLDTDPDLKGYTIPELKAMHDATYHQLLPFADQDDKVPYDSCAGNPDYSTALVGKELGNLLSALYSNLRSQRQLVLQQRYRYIYEMNSLLLGYIKDVNADMVISHTWQQNYQSFVQSNMQENMVFNHFSRFTPVMSYFKDILMQADLKDLRYLYRYGVYLSRWDFAMAEFINTYPEQELQALAEYIVKAFTDGFVRSKKDYRIKKYVTVMIPLGMEKLGRMVIKALDALGLCALVPLPMSAGVNKQYTYDHRFDNALYYTEDFIETSIATYKEIMETAGHFLADQAGPVYVELFGETPFSPVPKESACKLSEEQINLNRRYSSATSQLYHQYARRKESSFCIIAFPSAEIGDRFHEIFADTIKINLLDSGRYATIQQHIIDVLDGSDYVHVKGKPGNDTDIKVKMHPLNDPENETLFENCVADVNIPVGEVFTSPLLTGTNGTLHVEDIYLGNLRYLNLRIHFEDGWISDYSCSNFTDEKLAKAYIHENLLLPHKSLPIGEFAIGTNTTAYQIAKKYDIMQLLPILIIEKMGPHFAIGDTCFSHEEDMLHPSFVNGKNMIAVENEKSATRHDDPMNAYLQAHTDITLPYEMLESITAVYPDGSKCDIIRDGLFVVAGTEELNEALQKVKE